MYKSRAASILFCAALDETLSLLHALTGLIATWFSEALQFEGNARLALLVQAMAHRWGAHLLCSLRPSTSHLRVSCKLEFTHLSSYYRRMISTADMSTLNVEAIHIARWSKNTQVVRRNPQRSKRREEDWAIHQGFESRAIAAENGRKIVKDREERSKTSIWIQIHGK